MSILAGKNMAFVGASTPTMSGLQKELQELGVLIEVYSFDDVAQKKNWDSAPDMILLESDENARTATTVLNQLRAAGVTKKIPVIALAKNEPDLIQSVLTLGAADFFVENENLQTIMTKIETLLGQSHNFEGATVIDIPKDEANVDKTGVRVFVVEDDPLLRNLLSERFSKSEFPCEFSIDGKNVLPAAKKFEADVIILDLMLPGVSGFDILTEIKADSEIGNKPVIIFSNRAEQSDKQRAEELGAAKFYVKAMTNLSELVETIGKLA